MNRFWMADPHFNHVSRSGGILAYCDRPFPNISEMNERLIEYWNSRAGHKDLTYILGDLFWKEIKGEIRFKELMGRLNGKKVLITGSHDRIPIRYPCLFEEITPQKEIRIAGNHVTLNHYCMRVWPRSHFNSWHIHGHSHCRLESTGKSLDAGVDCHNFQLWSEEEIIEYMDKQPDNFNYHPRRTE